MILQNFLRPFFSLVFLWISTWNICAEDTLKLYNWKTGGIYHQGILVNHSDKVKAVNETNPSGFEVFASKQTTGTQEWNSFFNFPEYGISFLTMSVGNPNYLGNSYSLIPFMKFAFLNQSSPINLNLKVGAGIGYIERIYDPKSNPENLTIGSHINAALLLQLQASYRISGHISLVAGGGITHFSNGDVILPNTGLNILTGSIGASYSFGNKRELINSKMTNPSKRWKYAIAVSGGIKEISPIGGNKYFTSGLSFEVSRRHLNFTRFGFVWDVFYDSSDYDFLIRSSKSVSNRIETVKTGVGAEYSFIFGKLSVNLQLSTYLFSKNTEYGYIYQRNGLRYNITDRVWMQLALKNQKGKADHIEMLWGINLN